MLKYTLILALSLSVAFSSVIRQAENFIERNPEEGDLFEGDIAGVEWKEEKGAAQIITAKRGKWPNGVVPFVFDNVYNETLQEFFRSGMKLVEDATRNQDGSNCITFVPRTTEKTFIKVINGSGCWSYVGMQLTEGVQELSLKAPGCLVKGTVAHEFMHALGFWHEQSRPDRDDFIEVVWDKITEANRHNFNKYSTDLVDLLDLPYDYGSVMHYGDKGFSIDGSKTIVVKQPGATIGQRVNLSPIDAQEIRKYYGCN